MRQANGTTLIELMIGVSILAPLAGVAVPMLLATQDAMQIEGVARHLAAEAMLVRSQAAKHGTAVWIPFEQDNETVGAMISTAGRRMWTEMETASVRRTWRGV